MPDHLAFLSYVHEDDRHDHGRISELRTRLNGEVEAQSGGRFGIFQDRLHIEWGQDWRQRLGDSLGSALFLIPILTPRYFKSQYCRWEFEAFLKREQQLGRNDLIFPLHYLDCPMLGEAGKRSTSQIVRTLRARQYADWHAFRHEPITGPEAGKRIAELAKAIVAASKRAPAKRGAAVAAKPATDPSLPPGSGPAAQRRPRQAAPAPSTGLAPATDPPTPASPPQQPTQHEGDYLLDERLAEFHIELRGPQAGGANLTRVIGRAFMDVLDDIQGRPNCFIGVTSVFLTVAIGDRKLESRELLPNLKVAEDGKDRRRRAHAVEFLRPIDNAGLVKGDLFVDETIATLSPDADCNAPVTATLTAGPRGFKIAELDERRELKFILTQEQEAILNIAFRKALQKDSDRIVIARLTRGRSTPC